MAYVTGGARGIVLSVGKGVGEAGSTVIITCRNRVRLKQAVSELQSQGLDAAGFPFDVTDALQVDVAIKAMEAALGPVDILVNNAGTIRRMPAADLEESDWNVVIQTNLTARFIVSKRVG